MYLIQIDSGGAFHTIQSGTAQRQAALNANTPNGKSIFALTGTTGGGKATSSSVLVGRVNLTVPTVSQSAQVIFDWDFNKGGVIAKSGQGGQGVGHDFGMFGGFDPSTGRLPMAYSCAGQNNAAIQDCFIANFSIYYYDSGKGFLVETTNGGSAPDEFGAVPFNQALSGPLLAQAIPPGGTFTDDELVGTYIAGAGGSSLPQIPNLDLASNFDASGGWSSVLDFTSPTLSVGINGQTENFYAASGFYNLTYGLSMFTFGEGTMTFTAGTFNDFSTPNNVVGKFWVIGPRQFVAIGEGPQGNGGDPSGILYFDPQ
jgi:hypothetical protein